MFLSSSEFEQQYGAIFQTKRQEIENYLRNPEQLQEEIRRENESLARHRSLVNLPAPSPDKFAYRSTILRGLFNHEKRLQNYIVSQAEGVSIIRRSLPVRMDIEPISQCNFRCVMCQVSGWKGGKRAENMTLDRFKGLVDAQYGLTEVKLQGFGEPLMHKEYIEMIEYLVSLDIWVRTTVNGSLLHIRDNYKRLVDSGLGDCNVSFDGATKDVFEGIRRRSNFELVKENLKKFNDYAEKRGRSLTMMWVVLQKSNRDQIFKFVELAKQLNFKRLTFSSGLSDWGQEEWSSNNKALQVQTLKESEIDRLLKISDSSDLKISFWDLRAKYIKTDKKNLCVWPFQWAFVGSDMRMSPCCMIGNPDVIYTGDASNVSKSWNGTEMMEFRRKHIDGNIPKVCLGCYKNE